MANDLFKGVAERTFLIRVRTEKGDYSDILELMAQGIEIKPGSVQIPYNIRIGEVALSKREINGQALEACENPKQIVEAEMYQAVNSLVRHLLHGPKVEINGSVKHKNTDCYGTVTAIDFDAGIVSVQVSGGHIVNWELSAIEAC